MARVVLKSLVKAYPTKSGVSTPVVDHVNLEIVDREFMVLVGPSGCGKSTTLRMIAGLEEISAGEIWIDDKVVNDVSPKDRDIAMVFQNYALYPHMSVYDNLAFSLQLRGAPKAEIDTRVREAAALLGLTELLDRRPKALSGGQRQRVAVGRAIVRRPKVFLFDEPLSNLDAKMRVSMRAEISKLHRQLDATMVYVTHDQVEAMTMGDRICVMKDGKVQQVAPPLELYRHPANLFVASFIGSPPMNLIRGTLRADGSELTFVETNASGSPLTLRLPPALGRPVAQRSGQAVVLGIRPEHLTIGSSTPHARLCVEVAEPLGAETFLHLAATGHPWIARTTSTTPLRAGEIAAIEFDLAHAHLFDPSTGARLASSQ